jgi:hypothetical protein
VVALSGTGFAPYEQVDIFVDEGEAAVEATADAGGNLTVLALALPGYLAGRSYTVIAFGVTSKLLGETTVGPRRRPASGIPT